MSPYGGIVLFCSVLVLNSSLAPAQSAGAVPGRSSLASLVVAVQDADYRGELARLRAIAAELERYTTDPGVAPVARYWRGFAHWRHALNSLNDGAPADSVDRDFQAAIAEFREALAIDSADIEARIGLAAGLGNRAYFNRQVPQRYSAFMAELRPLMQHIRQAAPDNPRMMFVASASLFWTPQNAGGDRQQALMMLERGIRIAASQPPSAEPLKPAWGEAELHMLLAWFSLNLTPPDVASALGTARRPFRSGPNGAMCGTTSCRRFAGAPAGHTCQPSPYESTGWPP